MFISLVIELQVMNSDGDLEPGGVGYFRISIRRTFAGPGRDDVNPKDAAAGDFA